MLYQLIHPSAHLRHIIKDYTILRFLFDTNSVVPLKPFPANPDQNLVFYLRGGITAHQPGTGITQKFAKISINGSQISRFNFQPTHDYLMLNVNFQPGALSKFLCMPLIEFTDVRIDAEAVLNPGISEVYEQLVNAPSYAELIPIVENYLWQRLLSLKTYNHPIDRAITTMNTNAGFAVEKLASTACLSISQFERRFLQLTGVTPKFYDRINRFNYAYRLKDSNAAISWLGIALKAGYHDYQHLVKDFKTFSGATPNSLIAAQANAPERIAGIG